MRLTVPLLALLLAALPAAAQQPPPPAQQQRPDTTTMTPTERALARLRARAPVATLDTASELPDTARLQPQTVTIAGRAPAGAPAGGIQRDSIVNALLRLQDYVLTEYRGDTAHFSAETGRLELRGNPQVEREGNQLASRERIVYDRDQAFACGYGEPVLRTPQMTNPIASDTVCYYVDRQIGYARGAETTVDQGASWHMQLRNMYFDGRTSDVYSHGGRFTDCDLPWDHKHYYIDAREIKVVRHNVMVARNLTWYFQDVPVFWMPFIVQSLSQGRRSGILMPRFGINDIARNNARYNRRIEDIGVYLAISEHVGAELALDWFADNWTGLRGSLDYRWIRQFLNGGVTYRMFWQQQGGRDFTISTQNSWEPDERTGLSLTANYTTSTSFIRRGTFDPRELNRSIDSNASLRRRFDWGNLSIGAQRRQFLSDNTVTSQLPNLNLTLTPITLFSSLPGDERWYSNASWQGGLDMRIDETQVGDGNRSLTAQNRRQLGSNVRSGLNVGRLSLNQQATFEEVRRDLRVFEADTIDPLPAWHEQSGRWSASIAYQQPLIGTSSLTPSVSLGSRFVRSDSSDQALVMAPTRIDFSVGLRTDLYGFWPGVGPFERLRHRVSPSFSWGYSPEATADSLQRRLFRGEIGAQERNQVTMSVSQTFEAKWRGETIDTAAAAAADTAADAGPRRRQTTRTVQLLSISTDMIAYDFVEARTGHGFRTTSISNSLQSELLRGLQLTITHDLFDTPAAAEGAVAQRRFAPHLSAATASFSLSGSSWLFRLLGLGPQDSVPTRQGSPEMQTGDPFQGGPATDRTQSEFGLVGGSRRMGPGARAGGQVGSWNANMTYTMSRPRVRLPGQESQLLRGNMTFQPTENWSVGWNTAYSLTTKQFSDHVLTLTRRLHDWDANFDFLKAQNGNFSFQFRVQLRANPDIKVDYTQSDARALRGPGF